MKYFFLKTMACMHEEHESTTNEQVSSWSENYLNMCYFKSFCRNSSTRLTGLSVRR